MWYTMIGRKVKYQESEYYVHDAHSFSSQTLLELRPILEDGSLSDENKDWLVVNIKDIEMIGEYKPNDQPTTFLDRDINRISQDAIYTVGRVADELRYSIMRIKYGSYSDNPLSGTRLSSLTDSLTRLETLIRVRDSFPKNVTLPTSD